MKIASLCFIIDFNNKKVLLAMKKTGFGKGKWNGVGGKFEVEKGDKSIEDTAIRETIEEVRIIPKSLRKIGILDFYFEYKPEFNHKVYVYLIENWEGDPKETQEMKPKWFNFSQIPYDKMWPDDRYWFPYIIKNLFIKGNFIFGKKEDIIQSKLEVPDLNILKGGVVF